VHTTEHNLEEETVSETPLLLVGVIAITIMLVLAGIVIFKSLHNIGPSQVGLVVKRFGKKLEEGDLIAKQGEAGYQPDLLMPGWRFKLWPLYRITKHDWVQVPPGAIGVVVAQVGAAMPTGAKSAAYNDALGDFSNLREFLDNGGQRGVQRPVLPPGTTIPMHPVAFVVATYGRRFGVSLSQSTEDMIERLRPDDLKLTEITPEGNIDVVGIVTTLEGPPSPSGSIANRLGEFADIAALEQTESGAQPAEVIQLLLGTKNSRHNNYQDFQAFLDQGGCIGLQHDPLTYGSYLLNPFLVKVQRVPMLVVNQGEVAVIKSYVGLPTVDTSGTEYKFGSIVAPGHRGLWSEPLRTGKYALNPRIYDAEKVPTSILTLNWAKATSEAHNLDARLSSIDAKSKEAFGFIIDLQVQIHVPDTRAPQVIGMVGTMQNLVNEVLQSAVGNYFRNALQELGAIEFIEQRSEVQANAEEYVVSYLNRYSVEVRGVYIQDVVFPKELVEVLTNREIANQEKQTYAAQQIAQESRVALERQRGTADSQVELAKSEVSIQVNEAKAKAAIAEADGQATVTRKLADANAAQISAIGEAEALAIKAKGLAEADAYEAQQQAIGRDQTALVAVVNALGAGGITKLVPDTLVGATDGAGALGGLLTLLTTQQVTNGHKPRETDAVN
jgi:uncharacterized membrane protein YqiK